MAEAHKNCQHKMAQLQPSPFAPFAGYSQPKAQIRAAAESIRASKKAMVETMHTFPAPLILPHDELNYDPDQPPQSATGWLHMKSRNRMDEDDGRDTLFIARVPKIGKDVGFMRDWATPNLEQEGGQTTNGHSELPGTDLLLDYLKAYYHRMQVDTLPETLCWTSWDRASQPRRKANLPKYVALSDGNQRTRIRIRKSPDGIFAAQLNLDDIVDAGIRVLPRNAYALLLLVDQDMYETEDDDFCCGRAYGGSRVAVVQTARYNPALDLREGVDREHMWPLSHCKAFVNRLCAVEGIESPLISKRNTTSLNSGPMKAAMDSAMSLSAPSDLQDESMSLWFSRLARTVSHELGHCFGIAHCVYYACNMQGTAGMKEDVRQPPYLCPICESKVGHAIVIELHGGSADGKRVWLEERLNVLTEFCNELEKSEMSSAMWRGLSGWATGRARAQLSQGKQTR